jgi:hypothetical protein
VLALRALGRSLDYLVIDVDSLVESDARGGYGTPTVLYRNAIRDASATSSASSRNLTALSGRSSVLARYRAEVTEPKLDHDPGDKSDR